MARWRLSEPHYLRVKGVTWEYTETERVTGRPKRTQFEVPQLLDPRIEDDLKVFGQGTGDISTWDIIVCNGHNPEPKDIVFHEKDGSPGVPTPSMIPLDDEAKEISAKYAKGWNQQYLEATGQTYAENLTDKLLQQISELQAGAKSAPQADGLSEMMAAMTAVMKQNAEILAKLTERRV